MNEREVEQLDLLAVKPTTAARLLDSSRTAVYGWIKAGLIKTGFDDSS